MIEIDENLRIARNVSYRDLADPLFFKWQRGEATKQEWLDTVQAVRDAIPYPEDPETAIAGN